jgi:hypothetical protein
MKFLASPKDVQFKTAAGSLEMTSTKSTMFILPNPINFTESEY